MCVCTGAHVCAEAKRQTLDVIPEMPPTLVSTCLRLAM